MKISEGALDLGTMDYAVALDPSYTMLEFDSLRVLPMDTGLCDKTTSSLGVKVHKDCFEANGNETLQVLLISENNPEEAELLLAP